MTHPSTSNVVSLMSANYVARQLGYHMTGGWAEGDLATNEYFRPAETFPERFGALLDEMKALDVEAIDIWTGHLNPVWATPDHVIAAKEELRRTGLSVASLAGGFGDTPEAFERSCKLAAELGAPVLGGSSGLLSSDRDTLLEIAREHDVIFGFENHPGDKTSDDVRARIGAPDPHLGVALDTGWFGTYSFDGVQAIRDLSDVLVHVHLKDVRAAGGHETCRYGEGVVPTEACVLELKRLGYTGGISVEHEPEHFDPAEDCRVNIQLLEGWLAQVSSRI